MTASVAAVGFGLWQIARVVQPPATETEAEPFVKIATDRGTHADRLLQQRAEYFDPTPLFFPTAGNFGQGRTPPALRREPDEGFRNFSPSFQFSSDDLSVYGVDPVSAPGNLAEVIDQGNEAPFSGAARLDRDVPPPPKRGMAIDVKLMGTNYIAHRFSVEGAEVPRVEFAPFEFVLLVDRAGVVGEPLLVASSGSDAIDAFARDYLVGAARLDARLSPGKYLVSVGP